MQLVHSQSLTADFNADLIQAQREALKALRQVMAETADPAADDNAQLDDDDLQTRAARFRRLSLRLRAATAILRVKPLADASPDAPATAPPGTHANSSSRSPSPRDTELARDTTTAPPPTAANPQAPHATTQHQRLPDSTPKRNGTLSTAASPPPKPPFTGGRS